MKKFIIAAAITATLLFGATASAQAATSVKIFLGFPHYSYKVGSDYVYRRGYGWYSPRYNRVRMSCSQAKSRVWNRGFRNVSTVECRGATYTFRGTRGGKRHVIHVNSRSGGIW